MPLDTPILFLATTEEGRATRFYRDALGLTFVSSDSYAIVFRVGELTLRIQKVDHVRLAPYTALGWRVPDLKAELARLTARGVTFEHYPGLDQDSDGIWRTPGGSHVAWFKDPDGHILSLVQSPPP
jgi:catechol 2,3-dioxygenase-like lactoylglutathione lyase family enzyme